MPLITSFMASSRLKQIKVFILYLSLPGNFKNNAIHVLLFSIFRLMTIYGKIKQHTDIFFLLFIRASKNSIITKSQIRSLSLLLLLLFFFYLPIFVSHFLAAYQQIPTVNQPTAQLNNNLPYYIIYDEFQPSFIYLCIKVQNL